MAPDHQCRVFASPWMGVYGTHTQSASRYGRHWHATYGLGVLEHGAHSSASWRGQVEAYAGDVITTNPGEVHDGRPHGGPSRRWRIVYLDPEIIASMTSNPASAASANLAFTRPVIQDPRLRSALCRLLDRLQGWSASACPTRADVLACEESLVEACAMLLERHATAAPVQEAGANVREVRARLADDLLNPPTLAEMALMAGLSKYQVLRRFDRVYGLTPHAWLLQQRAERARVLIRSGAGLAMAAASTGFADQSHMTRAFVRRFGFTPGAWQRTVARAGPSSQRQVPKGRLQ